MTGRRQVEDRLDGSGECQVNKPTANAVYVDWGTSSFRAYLVDETGNCLDQRASVQGVKKIDPGSCEAVLQENIGDWLEGDRVAKILMAGMVGSDLGWCAVPLVRAPCVAAMIAENLFTAQHSQCAEIQIVPGVASCDDTGHVSGIMRGEEVQVLGGMALQNEKNAVFCLPGSHSKWVNVSEGSITSIRTFMTGELFDLMCGQSVLADCMRHAGAEMDRNTFVAGVDCVRSGGNLLEAPFRVRAEFVADPHRSPVERKSFVSGVMIGSEIAAATAEMKADRSGELIVIGSQQLLSAYHLAFTRHGHSITCIQGEEAFIAGCRLLQGRAPKTAS